MISHRGGFVKRKNTKFSNFPFLQKKRHACGTESGIMKGRAKNVGKWLAIARACTHDGLNVLFFAKIILSFG
jgi:hypothetical protein